MKKQWPYFLLAFLLPVCAVLWWWGLFSSAKVEIAERGGYRYAYLEAEGVYSKLASKQKEVLFELNKQGIQSGAQITVLLSDPRSTPHEQLRARTGYLVNVDAAIRPPLMADNIQPRRVVVASIKAHPLFAYGKTYSALLDYAGQHQLTLHLPTVEIYEASTLHVEMPLVSKGAAS